MDKVLIDKLKIKKDYSVLVINAPTEYLERLPVAKTKFTAKDTFDVVQIFVKSKADLLSVAKKAVDASSQNGLLWICYPKKSSTIKTDLSRDDGWESMTKLNYEVVSLVAIDNTWSALRFCPVKKDKTKVANTNSVIEINKEERKIIVPEVLQDAFNAKKKAKEFFETLSYTNKKEYVVWITSAKREETLERRIKETISKLLNGKKNPSEK